MTGMDGSIRTVSATLVAIWMLIGPSVNTRTSVASAPTSEAEVAPEEVGQICVSIAKEHGTITVGHGVRRIDISLMGGACEPPGPAISGLWASYPADDDSPLDIVDVDDCPAYQAKIDELWSAKHHHVRLRSAPRGVQAGPFSIADSDDLFDLKSKRGRQAAARWVRGTLAAVRPCWNTTRQDQTLNVVDDLYGRLSIPLPSALAPRKVH